MRRPVEPDRPGSTRYLARDDDREWAAARRNDVRALKELLQHDVDAFCAEMWSLIDQKRARFKLPQLPAAARQAAGT